MSKYENVTNERIMAELVLLRRDIDGIRQMLYDTNSDFYDTWQITCSNRESNFKPLTNRELLLYLINKYPMEDVTTWREKLLTKEEMHEQYGIPLEMIKHGFEEKQGVYREYIDDFDDDNDTYQNENNNDSHEWLSQL